MNVRRKWFAGVVSAIPTTSSQVRALSASGLYAGAGTYKFTIGNYKTFVICIPTGTIKEVSLERYQYNFMDLDSAATPDVYKRQGKSVLRISGDIIIFGTIHFYSGFGYAEYSLSLIHI